MKRFYSSNISQSLAVLERKERDHCIKVLRTQIGEKVEVVDGKGNLFIGEIVNADKRTVDISIIESISESKKKPFITIACCIPKNASRWETFLEKSTEIGVEKIIPLIAKRSEKSNLRRERNEQILVSAFKQSGHLFLPQLQEPSKFKDVLLLLKEAKHDLFIAHCDDQHKEFLGNVYKKGEEALILIGPEGDFTQEEINLAIKYNFKPVSLGSSRLRVETAGIVAAGIINWVNELA